MKRARCPKCDQYITFDETKYAKGQALVFVCPYCGKQFGIRLGVSKLKDRQDDIHPEEEEKKEDQGCGSIVVIENNYGYKQVFPLHEGDNVIGRYKKNYDIDCPIESGDLNIDYTHCVINVSRNKQGRLKYVLRDGPSYKGTFVDGERLSARDRRIIEGGTVFTVGLTSVILKTPDDES